MRENTQTQTRAASRAPVRTRAPRPLASMKEEASMSEQVSIPPCPHCRGSNSTPKGINRKAQKPQRFCKTCHRWWIVGATHGHRGVYTTPPCPRCESGKTCRRGSRGGKIAYFCFTCQSLWVAGAQYHRGLHRTALCKICGVSMGVSSRRRCYCSVACRNIGSGRQITAVRQSLLHRKRISLLNTRRSV